MLFNGDANENDRRDCDLDDVGGEYGGDNISDSDWGLANVTLSGCWYNMGAVIFVDMLDAIGVGAPEPVRDTAGDDGIATDGSFEFHNCSNGGLVVCNDKWDTLWLFIVEASKWNRFPNSDL